MLIIRKLIKLKQVLDYTAHRATFISNQQSVISNQSSLHQVGEFFAGLEVGIGLGGGAGHLVVTTDEGFGELFLELDQEGDEGAALGDSAGVLGLAAGIEAAFVADADGAAVEGAAMGADFVKAAVLGGGAILADVIMVADVDEAA